MPLAGDLSRRRAEALLRASSTRMKYDVVGFVNGLKCCALVKRDKAQIKPTGGRAGFLDPAIGKRHAQVGVARIAHVNVNSS
jgi:hypothetical protein